MNYPIILFTALGTPGSFVSCNFPSGVPFTITNRATNKSPFSSVFHEIYTWEKDNSTIFVWQYTWDQRIKNYDKTGTDGAFCITYQSAAFASLERCNPSNEGQLWHVIKLPGFNSYKFFNRVKATCLSEKNDDLLEFEDCTATQRTQWRMNLYVSVGENPRTQGICEFML
ncbi:hypothetical protein Fcan01_24474 [Folsomia candida]|uniref:Uncharacterized protein n=1 Tax=Folsomia candida TaxID=158441 RepID=A0A226D7Q0_FOLCA|nr:hypothetical protein Fcan01_24474 [Folsomia candida]